MPIYDDDPTDYDARVKDDAIENMSTTEWVADLCKDFSSSELNEIIDELKFMRNLKAIDEKWDKIMGMQKKFFDNLSI